MLGILSYPVGAKIAWLLAESAGELLHYLCGRRASLFRVQAFSDDQEYNLCSLGHDGGRKLWRSGEVVDVSVMGDVFALWNTSRGTESPT
jgi:hypothetical protein